MAQSYEDFKGPFVVTAKLAAKPGKADEVFQWLVKLKARADSKDEPGTLYYEVVRNGDNFVAWEKYANAEALQTHRSDLLKDFFSKGLFEVVEGPTFYPIDYPPQEK